jgi:hypothetical protein
MHKGPESPQIPEGFLEEVKKEYVSHKGERQGPLPQKPIRAPVQAAHQPRALSMTRMTPQLLALIYTTPKHKGSGKSLDPAS